MTWQLRSLQVLAIVLGATTLATAQTIGTFSWQTQPYCNVVTVTVIQHGTSYQLVGRDNLCGSGIAPVTGTAVPIEGDVRLGVSIASATGRAAHLTATIDLISLSGAWSDDDGHTGAFVFGGSASGAPRPAPSVVRAPRTTRVLYNEVTSSQGGTVSPPVQLRELGTFTSNGGPLRLTWTSHVATTPSAGLGGCNFQLRIDGAPSAPATSADLVGDEAVVIAGLGTRVDAPATVTTWFNAVPAGTHTISLWVRSVQALCSDNAGNFTRTVLVEEYGTP